MSAQDFNPHSPINDRLTAALDRRLKSVKELTKTSATNSYNNLDEISDSIDYTPTGISDVVARNKNAAVNDYKLESIPGTLLNTAMAFPAKAAEWGMGTLSAIDTLQANSQIAKSNDETTAIYSKERNRNAVVSRIGEVQYQTREGLIKPDEGNTELANLRKALDDMPRLTEDETALLDQVAHPNNIYEQRTHRELLDEAHVNLDQAKYHQDALKNSDIYNLPNRKRVEQLTGEIGKVADGVADTFKTLRIRSRTVHIGC